MQIGTLIRGNINELIGMITAFKRSSSGYGMVKVYWFDIQEHSINWLFADHLQVIDET